MEQMSRRSQMLVEMRVGIAYQVRIADVVELGFVDVEDEYSVAF
jgi:hypothetical protein